MKRWISENSVLLIALGGTLFGGAGLEATKHWLSKSRVEDDTARDLRVELRSDLGSLRNELLKTQGELGRWRSRYYILVEQYIRNKANLDDALEELHEAGSSFERINTMTIDELLEERKENEDEV